jgi:hypothetical protein
MEIYGDWIAEDVPLTELISLLAISIEVVECLIPASYQ